MKDIEHEDGGNKKQKMKIKNKNSIIQKILSIQSFQESKHYGQRVLKSIEKYFLSRPINDLTIEELIKVLLNSKKYFIYAEQFKKIERLDN